MTKMTKKKKPEHLHGNYTCPNCHTMGEVSITHYGIKTKSWAYSLVDEIEKIDNRLGNHKQIIYELSHMIDEDLGEHLRKWLDIDDNTNCVITRNWRHTYSVGEAREAIGLKSYKDYQKRIKN